MNKKTGGLFISFEGVDGCGKSTQIRFLCEYLDELGIKYLCTREPGGAPISEAIRDILLDVSNSDMNSMTEALLYAAARVQHIDEVILPALARGELVICDRFVDSSMAYQGYGRGLGEQTIRRINAYAYTCCMPDVTLFLDVAPDAATKRMHRRHDKDRLELAGREFFDRVYNGFLAICEKEPQRVRRIDVSGTKFETRDKLRAVMDALLERR